MSRVNKKPEIRRAEIIEASLELFRENGYNQTAVDDIVNKLGIAKGTFYYHFKTKYDIMIAIVERLAEEKVNMVKVLAETEGMTVEAKMYTILWEQPYEDESKIIEFLHHEHNASIHQKVLVQAVQDSAPYVTQILNQGMAEGTFQIQDPQETAEFILVGINFMFDPGIFLWSEDIVERKKLAFTRIIERMLGDSFTFSNLSKTSLKQK
ncbi:TetR/AcrR family transcriptional regulator [Paenibacillus sp. FSL K6-3182]|uniref:TetR/AcrR family transcriptional regulator n=1 Tax=Paenibacillus sp. FSL K6-3182 TaxID=2921495 RepID=UPI0030D4033E